MNLSRFASRIVLFVVCIRLDAVSARPVCAGGGAGGELVPCYEIAAIIQGPASPPFGAPITVGTAISPNGEYVVGSYHFFAGSDDRGWVYRTTTGQFSVLPTPPGISVMYVNDVNDAGLAVGHIGGVSGDFGFVFNLISGQYLAQIPAVVTTGGNGASLAAINAQGVACGTRTISLNPTRDNAFTWSANNGVVDMGLYNGASTSSVDLNDSGWITGSTLVNGVNTPFILGDGQVTLLGTLANLNSSAHAINNRSEVVGSSPVPNSTPPPANVSRGFLWSAGTMSELEPLPGDLRSVAQELDDNGLVGGYSRFDAPLDTAVVWDSTGIHNLNDLTQDLPTGTRLISVNGMNSRGMIVAGAHDQFFDYMAIVLSPVLAVGDVNSDCRVNMDDLLGVIADWGETDSPADVDGSGLVNVEDLMIVIREWST